MLKQYILAFLISMVPLIELRGVDGKNVSALTVDNAAVLAHYGQMDADGEMGCLRFSCGCG